MKEPNWFHFWIYSIFYYVWNPLFRQNHRIGKFLAYEILKWYDEHPDPQSAQEGDKVTQTDSHMV